MKIGIIGLGAISPYFLAAVERDDTLDLAAVCDRDEARMAPFTRGRSASFDWTSTEVSLTSQTSPPRFTTSTLGSILTRAACSGRSRFSRAA